MTNANPTNAVQRGPAAQALLLHEAWMPSPADVRRQTADILASLAEEEEAVRETTPSPAPVPLRSDSGFSWLAGLGALAAAIGWLLCFWSWSAYRQQAADLQAAIAARTESAAQLQEERTKSDAQNHQLQDSLHHADLLRRALAMLAPTNEEQNQLLLVNYVDPSTLAREESRGTATLKVRNVVLPVIIRWTSGDENHSQVVYSGEKSISLPAGRPVTIFCEPLIARNWYQIAALSVGKTGEEKLRGNTLSKFTVPIAPGDELALTCSIPTAPWNGIVVPCRGAWMLVTLERPRADFQLEEWKDPAKRGPEEFSNTMLFWAKYGDAELGRELAAHFVAQRGKPRDAGHYRGRMHTAITIGSSDTGVIQEPWASIQEEELRLCLTNAFQMMRRHRSPTGRSIEDELQQAAKILEELRSQP